MLHDPVARYLRYYRYLRFFRRLGARFALYALCTRFPHVWPKADQEVFFKKRWSTFFDRTDRIWLDYQRNSIYSDIVAQTVEFKNLRIEVDDPHQVLGSAKTTGCLFLTFHHQFALHFPAVLGTLGVRVNAMTADPMLSPLKRLLEHYPDYFSKFERSFSGGRFFYQNPQLQNLVEMKQILLDLQSGTSLVSCHDFESPYVNAKAVRIDTPFFSVNAPVGVVPYCAKRGMKVIFGYLSMHESNGFIIHLRPYVSNGMHSSDGVFEFYRSSVEATLTSNPELFDLWHAQI